MGDWTNKLYDFCRQYKSLDRDHDNKVTKRTQVDKAADEATIDMHFNGKITAEKCIDIDIYITIYICIHIMSKK